MKYEVIGGDVRNSAVSYEEALQTDGVYAISGNMVPEGNDYYLVVSASPSSSRGQLMPVILGVPKKDKRPWLFGVTESNIMTWGKCRYTLTKKKLTVELE